MKKLLRNKLLLAIIPFAIQLNGCSLPITNNSVNSSLSNHNSSEDSNSVLDKNYITKGFSINSSEPIPIYSIGLKYKSSFFLTDDIVFDISYGFIGNAESLANEGPDEQFYKNNKTILSVVVGETQKTIKEHGADFFDNKYSITFSNTDFDNNNKPFFNKLIYTYSETFILPKSLFINKSGVLGFSLKTENGENYCGGLSYNSNSIKYITDNNQIIFE